MLVDVEELKKSLDRVTRLPTKAGEVLEIPVTQFSDDWFGLPVEVSIFGAMFTSFDEYQVIRLESQAYQLNDKIFYRWKINLQVTGFKIEGVKK